MSSPLSSILLIGGNGSLAQHITTRFVAKGTTVHSVIRNPRQIPHLKSLGASPIVQSVEDSSASDFAELIARLDPQAVIWSAGAGGPSASAARLKAVDTDGCIKVMDAVARAAEESGGKTTRRFVSISSIEVRDEVSKPLPSWYDDGDREYSRWMKAGGFRPYFDARLASDRALVKGNGVRKLDYTIIRPGWMHSGPGKGRIGAGRCNISGQVSRADVTTVLELCLERSETIGLVFDVAEGDVPIEKAVAAAEDSFEGYY